MLPFLFENLDLPIRPGDKVWWVNSDRRPAAWQAFILTGAPTPGSVGLSAAGHVSLIFFNHFLRYLPHPITQEA